MYYDDDIDDTSDLDTPALPGGGEITSDQEPGGSGGGSG